MYRIRIVSSTKRLWLLGNETVSFHGTTRVSSLVAPLFALPPQTARTFHLSAPNCSVAASEIEPSLFKRFLRKIGFVDIGKYKRTINGYLLYEDIVKSIDYPSFFKDFQLPDTFYSWFIITELHVWMLMLRFMAEGKNGQEVRNVVVEAMWTDVNARKSKLKSANPVALRKQVNELSTQFNAAVIGYDEGILSDDKVLAGALWRRFYHMESNNPELVEKLVAYVRKQVNELEKLPSREVMTMKSTKWLNHWNP